MGPYVRVACATVRQTVVEVGVCAFAGIFAFFWSSRSGM